MKMLLIFIAMITTAHASRKISSTIPTETIERLKKIYPDQSEAFILQRLGNANSAFQKWRSFPPYYYELLTRLEGGLSSRQGLCAGDAHLENFGFIYAKSPVFTLNDLDDVSPCSLDADVLRLFIGQRLVTSVSTQDFLKAYESGLNGERMSYPEFIANLEKESLDDKTKMSKKYKNILKTGICDGDFSAVTTEEAVMLEKFAQSESKKIFLSCSRFKDSGGSAGSKRFIVFHKVEDKSEVFELKPLTTPSPLYNKKLSLEERSTMFIKALNVYFGESFKSDYYPVRLDGKLYQRRPMWKGNAEIKENKLSVTDLKEVMLFEANTLGLLHQKSNASAMQMNHVQFEKKALEIEAKWKGEFGE